jgi:NTP pyrophosphatase (non-canonical NTP hydrolase)
VDNEAEIILMEECGELIQALSKVIRTGGRKDTVANLKQEIADVQVLISFVCDKHDINSQDLNYRMSDKVHKLKRWSNLYGSSE